MVWDACSKLAEGNNSYHYLCCWIWWHRRTNII